MFHAPRNHYTHWDCCFRQGEIWIYCLLYCDRILRLPTNSSFDSAQRDTAPGLATTYWPLPVKNQLKRRAFAEL